MSRNSIPLRQRPGWPTNWPAWLRLTGNAAVILTASGAAIWLGFTQRGNSAFSLTFFGLAAVSLLLAKIFDVFAADSDVTDRIQKRLKYASSLLQLAVVLFGVPAVATALEASFWDAVAKQFS